MLTMGPKVGEFEAQLAAACEVEHALACTSGTAALHLAVLALGLEPGDEILVPAYTFPATGNVVELAGLKPVLVDVDPETMNIDPGRVEVGPRTKAVLAVHLFGRPAPLEDLPSELLVLEDAAGALGARYRGRACGGLGLLGCLSFHPRKIVTTGEGGAVTTNDARIAEEVATFRNHGWRSLDAARHAGARVSTTGSRTSSAPSASRRCAASTSCSPSARASRTATASGCATCRCSCRAPTTATSTAGRPTCCRSTTATASSPGCASRGSRRRSAPTRCTSSAPIATRATFPGAARVFERALALPFHTRLSDGELDRVAEALDKLVSSH